MAVEISACSTVGVNCASRRPATEHRGGPRALRDDRGLRLLLGRHSWRDAEGRAWAWGILPARRLNDSADPTRNVAT